MRYHLPHPTQSAACGTNSSALVVEYDALLTKPENLRCKRCLRVHAALAAGRPAYSGSAWQVLNALTVPQRRALDRVYATAVPQPLLSSERRPYEALVKLGLASRDLGRAGLVYTVTEQGQLVRGPAPCESLTKA